MRGLIVLVVCYFLVVAAGITLVPVAIRICRNVQPEIFEHSDGIEVLLRRRRRTPRHRH